MWKLSLYIVENFNESGTIKFWFNVNGLNWYILDNNLL